MLSLPLFAACGARTSLVERYDRLFPGEGGGGAGGAGVGGDPTATSTAVTTSVTTTATSVTTSTTSGQGGGVISLANDSAFEAETSVAVASTGLIAAAWISVGFDGTPFIAYTFSTDGGQTFFEPTSIPPVEDRYGSDPVLAADEAGTLYLTWVGFRIDPSGTPFDMQIYAARAIPGETQFAPPIVLNDTSDLSTIVDKPWITVSAQGTVLVSYGSYGSEGYEMIVARSVDGAQSFTRTSVIGKNQFNEFYNLGFLCTPTAASGGAKKVFLTYVALGNSADIRLSASDDDGLTFPTANEQIVSVEGDVAFTDPNCVTNGKEVWVSYGLTDQPAGRTEETARLHTIRLARSSDMGQSFDLWVDGQDSSIAAFFLLPQLGLEPGGALDISYFAGNFDEDPKAAFVTSRSPQGDGSFLPAQVLYQPLTFVQSRADPRWLGDYTGLTTRGKNLYLSYPVNDSGLSHVSFSALTFP